MAKTSAIVTYLDSNGKAVQKSLTDVNPNATSDQLVAFAKMLNDTSTNTYVSTVRVDKTNCDVESGDTRPTPTLAISKTTVSVADVSGEINGYSIPFTYDGDGKIFISATINHTNRFLGFAVRGNVILLSGNDFKETNHLGEVTVFASETENYKATAPVTITFTA